VSWTSTAGVTPDVYRMPIRIVRGGQVLVDWQIAGAYPQTTPSFTLPRFGGDLAMSNFAPATHLGHAQSERIVWLREKLELPYRLTKYTRDPVTRLAPPELKALHPLGTAPVVIGEVHEPVGCPRDAAPRREDELESIRGIADCECRYRIVGLRDRLGNVVPVLAPGSAESSTRHRRTRQASPAWAVGG
jgi:hypothetical protein